jgi:hypothetical protein
MAHLFPKEILITSVRIQKSYLSETEKQQKKRKDFQVLQNKQVIWINLKDLPNRNVNLNFFLKWLNLKILALLFQKWNLEVSD